MAYTNFDKNTRVVASNNSTFSIQVIAQHDLIGTIKEMGLLHEKAVVYNMFGKSSQHDVMEALKVICKAHNLPWREIYDESVLFAIGDIFKKSDAKKLDTEWWVCQCNNDSLESLRLRATYLEHKDRYTNDLKREVLQPAVGFIWQPSKSKLARPMVVADIFRCFYMKEEVGVVVETTPNGEEKFHKILLGGVRHDSSYGLQDIEEVVNSCGLSVLHTYPHINHEDWFCGSR